MTTDPLTDLLTDTGIPASIAPGLIADSKAGYELWRQSIGQVMKEPPDAWDALSTEQHFSIVLLVVSIQEVILGRLQLQAVPAVTNTLQ